MRWATLLLLTVTLAASGERSPSAEEFLRDGLAQLTRGQVEKAIAQLYAARRLYEEAGDLRGRAECHLALGVARTRLDTYDKALDDYAASLELWRQLDDPVGSWMVHFAVAEARFFLEEAGRALEAVEEAAKLLADLENDPSRVLSAESFRVVALAYGLPLTELATVSSHVPGGSGLIFDYLRIWTDVTRAKVLRLQGRYKEAGSVLEAARSRDEPLKILASVILDDIGEVYFEQGDFEQALIYFEQARASARSLRDAIRRELSVYGLPLEPAEVVRPYEVEALQHIAIVFMKKMQYEEALAMQRQALAIAKTFDRRELQGTLIADMGLCYLSQGLFPRALSRFEKSLEIAREVGNLQGEAVVLHLIGNAYYVEGQGELALKNQLSSVEAFRKMGHRAKVASGLVGVGHTYRSMAMLREASDYYQRALAITRENDQRSLASDITRIMAQLLISSGDLSEALSRGDRALAMARDLGDPVGQIEAHQIMAFTYRRLGQPEEAIWHVDLGLGLIGPDGSLPITIFLESIRARAYKDLNLPELAEEALLKIIDDCRQLEWENQEAIAKTHLADLYMNTGRRQEALPLLGEAEEILVQGRFQILLPELAPLSRAQVMDPVGSMLIDLHASRDDAPAAFFHAERVRARSLSYALRRAGNAAPAAGSDDLRHRTEGLRRHLAAIERELETEYFEADRTRWRRLLDQRREVRDRFVAALTELRLNQPEYASILDSEDAMTLAETQALLDEGVTLIAYYVLDSRVVAWVVDKTFAEVFDLGIGATELKTRVNGLARSLTGRGFDFEAAGLLYRRLFEPLRRYVRHERLIVVPHGALHDLPFAALWNAAEERFLAQDHALTYAPGAGVLRYLVRKRSPDSGRLLALGDPDGSLPGAAAEAVAIARIYGRRAYLGAEATESRLHEAAGRVDVLHVAAHGVVDSNPRFSHLALAADERHDGRLEVHELYWDLDLAGVNLVVLSACNTAKGHRGASDEILGLTRAFMYAGSPAVVTTQWPIDDEASGFLMKAFYRHLRAGANPADALRSAQLATLDQPRWSSPFYWSAFTLNGDWKSMEGEP